MLDLTEEIVLTIRLKKPKLNVSASAMKTLEAEATKYAQAILDRAENIALKERKNNA